MRLLVTDAAAQPPRQATAWLIMTLGRKPTATYTMSNMIDYSERFNEIGGAISQKAFSGASLEFAEAVIMDVYWQYVQVSNGGFEQWLGNSGIERAKSTVASLKTVGSSVVLRITEEFLATLPKELDNDAAINMHLKNLTPEEYEDYSRFSHSYYDFEEDVAALAVKYYESN